MRKIILERGFLQRNLSWKIEFLNCCLGSLPKEQLDEISSEITEVVRLRGSPNSWAVRNSKAMSRALRHELGQKLGKYLEASVEQLDNHTSLRPFNWEPRKFFAFPMANSKGRFQTWIAPVACSFKRFLDWDFTIGISAIQGHSRMPEQVSTVAQVRNSPWPELESWAIFSTPRRMPTTRALRAMAS